MKKKRRPTSLRGRLGFLLLIPFAGAAAQIGPPPPPPSVPAVTGAESAPERPRSAQRRSAQVAPYLEVAQVLNADLGGDGDLLTYTTIAAGVDGRVATRRVTAQVGYRYERHIPWNDGLADRDVHSGVAMLNYHAVPGLLDFDMGALAARTAGEGRTLGFTPRQGSVNVYSIYAGPTVSGRAGPVALNGSYRLGYVAIDDDRPGARSGTQDAVAHSAHVSAGAAPGDTAPVGWTIAGGYAREEAGRFNNRFEGAYARADVVAPVTPTLALTAGVGYETIRSSQRDFARDAAGAPILGPDGRAIPDPDRPRLLTYDIDGLIYDGGLIWRPGPRTELQARAGRRYGGTTFLGSFEHRFRRNFGMRGQVYDSVSTFGQLLVSDLSRLPSDFNVNPNPITGDLGLGGCIFGADPGSGVCLDRSLGAVGSSTFRIRGGNLIFSGNAGPWDLGAGAGYSRRRHFGPQDDPFAAFDRRVDESFTLHANAGRRLGRSSAIGLDAFASWFDSDSPGFDPVFSTGISGSYRRAFIRERLQLLMALGIYHSSSGDLDSTHASGLVGLRYNF